MKAQLTLSWGKKKRLLAMYLTFLKLSCAEKILLHIFMFLIEKLIKYFVTKIIFVTKNVKADFHFLSL